MRSLLRVLSLVVLSILGLTGLRFQPGSRHSLAEDAPPTAGVARLADEETEHPLDPALQLAHESLTHLRESVRDYTAILVKRERVNETLGEHQFLEVKIRHRLEENGKTVQPFSAYLHFLKPKSVQGREVIWVEKRDGNRLVAHEGGFKNLLRVKLDPQSRLAMFGQRYPITEIGIENLVVQLLEKGERDRRHGECKIRFFNRAKVDNRECTMIEVTHPLPRPYFDFYRARIYLDNELRVPIRYAAWTWPEEVGGSPLLIEEYTYTRLRLNVGLTDRDFDPDNPQYNYP